MHEGRGGKTTSGNGQEWNSPSPRGQWRTGKDGGNWLRNHLWCPNQPRGYGINDDDDYDDLLALVPLSQKMVCSSLVTPSRLYTIAASASPPVSGGRLL